MPVKVSTFKRTVKFTRPGEQVDTFVADSFVAQFQPLPSADLSAMRNAPGGLKDHEVLGRVLVGVDGDRTVAGVIDDPIESGAAVIEYFKAIGDGITGKNSRT